MTKPEPPFHLTDGDRMSPVWMKLMKQWALQLEVLRNQNDGDKSDTETAKLRGRIAQLKAVMALDKGPIVSGN